MPVHEKKQPRRLVLSRETIHSLNAAANPTQDMTSCGQVCTCDCDTQTF